MPRTIRQNTDFNCDGRARTTDRQKGANEVGEAKLPVFTTWVGLGWDLTRLGGLRVMDQRLWLPNTYWNTVLKGKVAQKKVYL